MRLVLLFTLKFIRMSCTEGSNPKRGDPMRTPLAVLEDCSEETHQTME